MGSDPKARRKNDERDPSSPPGDRGPERRDDMPEGSDPRQMKSLLSRKYRRD